MRKEYRWYRIIILYLLVSLFAGCQRANEMENNTREIEYIELASHGGDWDDVEFSVALDQFSPPETARRITTTQDAVQFGEELIENYPHKGDLVLKTVVFFKEENTWRFDYYSSNADQDMEHGGLFVVADGDSGKLLKAWVEE